MSTTPCHDAFTEAQIKRAQYPLPSGVYKLEEAKNFLLRTQATLDRRLGRSSGPFVGLRTIPLPMPLCMDHELRKWPRTVPVLIASELGMKILPGIKALTGDGVPQPEVDALVLEAEDQVETVLETAERLRVYFRNSGVTNGDVWFLKELTELAQNLIDQALQKFEEHQPT